MKFDSPIYLGSLNNYLSRSGYYFLFCILGYDSLVCQGWVTFTDHGYDVSHCFLRCCSVCDNVFSKIVYLFVFNCVLVFHDNDTFLVDEYTKVYKIFYKKDSLVHVVVGMVRRDDDHFVHVAYKVDLSEAS